MSEIQLTRAQRRAMKKFADRVDRITQADRLFFERFPHRQHRVRPSSQTEVGQNEIIDGKRVDLPPGWRWFTAVRNVAPGYRMCLLVPNLEGAETDLTEAVAREVFEGAAAPFTWQLEARLRKAAGVRP
jgi:hypothetical protein